MTRVVCVLGMHRSGTSCVTGTLEAAGVFLGEVFTHNKHNVKGNRESAPIMALHNDLLAASGGAWDAPPAGPARWTGEFRARRDAIIASYGGVPCWGFKDPRTLLALDGWLEALPDLSFAGVVRHPAAVAKSLHARTRLPLDRGVALWLDYNRRLDGCRADRDVPLVCFDQPAADLLQSLRALCVRLGLDPAAATGENAFFEEGLRHQGVKDPANAWEGISADARELYESLRAEAL